MIYWGFTSHSGITEVFNKPNFADPGSAYTKRFFYDLFFFIMLPIVVLEIIFGIIIDTFAELREDKDRKDFDAKNKCFICNLERTEFEKEGISFESHIQKEHNLWNYLYYIVYLTGKKEDDFNGTETYIFDKYKKEDLSWFPI